jgi:cobalt-zinc-cadmium efflux system outer membrane protein
LIALKATYTLCALCAFVATSLSAQSLTASEVVLSRDAAMRLAVQRSPRSALARAEVAAAAAASALARQFENPVLTASYSGADPRAHFSLDIPLDLPKVRAARIAAAQSGIASTTLRTAYGQALLELDVDTAYTRAEANAARSLLSARSARDADSLLTVARVRRDAGDASDLDVELARVFAGQSTNTAVNDSIAAIGSRATLQSLIGLSVDSARIALADSIAVDDSATTVGTIARLAASPGASFSTSNNSLPVAVALRDAEAASYRVLVEQRRRISAPSLSIGAETVQPGTSGLLPTVGISLPLPLFNRNAANIQVAQAELDRARVNIVVAQLGQTAALNGARRDANAAQQRNARSQQLVASANRIAALSLVAYREGAAPITTVLDAQRAARETLAQHVDDVATARIADSVLRFLSLSSVHQQ